jgi:alginate O-acetyltransferase complex protein AlgI
MLFNSTFFLFAFLPIALGGFLIIRRSGRARAALAWLVAASFCFYAWAQPGFFGLLLASILANFGIGLALQDAGNDRTRRLWLIAGIAANLLVLGVFKYAHFGLETWNALASQELSLPAFGLPLAISFFTFQQIAYLSDTANGRVRERSLLAYTLFVAFFPKLIAGPIVNHEEMMGQVDDLPGRGGVATDIAVGLTLFSMGLFKKVVLADAIAGRTGSLFDLAAAGIELGFFEAWVAALGFTFQVYFDFSGYSDMALGLARCFGIVLPLNFHSPYKAANIAEFWRRWHVTLTRWLRLFLFVPISRSLMRRGGGRWDGAAVAIAQLITMGLCGLWHGAGWNFVLWGGVHGLLLVAHDAWGVAKKRLGLVGRVPAPLGEALGRSLLLLVVAATFVIFRAADLGTAAGMLEAMSGAHGVFDTEAVERFLGLVGLEGALAMAGLLLVCWLAPNSQEILADYEPALDLRRFRRTPPAARRMWQPSPAWALFALACLLPSIYLILVEGYEEFIYRFF